MPYDPWAGMKAASDCVMMSHQRHLALTAANIERRTREQNLMDDMPSANVPVPIEVARPNWREGYLADPAKCFHRRQRYVTRWRCLDCGEVL